MAFFTLSPLVLLRRVNYFIVYSTRWDVCRSSGISARRFAVAVLTVFHEVFVVTGLFGRDAAGRIVDQHGL